MVDTSYLVVPNIAGGFDVQMAKPNGKQKIAPDFGSEHEANAWIVQAKRMKREAAPWTPTAARKHGGDTALRTGVARRQGNDRPQGCDDDRQS